MRLRLDIPTYFAHKLHNCKSRPGLSTWLGGQAYILYALMGAGEATPFPLRTSSLATTCSLDWRGSLRDSYELSRSGELGIFFVETKLLVSISTPDPWRGQVSLPSAREGGNYAKFFTRCAISRYITLGVQFRDQFIWNSWVKQGSKG